VRLNFWEVRQQAKHDLHGSIAHLITVPLIARKNRIEKSAPRIRSKVKAFFIIDLERPLIFGMVGGVDEELCA
jgi:hypothetical protein